MNIQYDLVSGNKIIDSHRKLFEGLLKKQGKVKGDLSNKADRCKLLCIASLNDSPVGIGAIKIKTESNFNDEKSGLTHLSSQFEWELGYVYILPEYQGKGVASLIVKKLIEEFGNEHLTATTEINKNPAMIKILEKNGFKQDGKHWKSSIHGENLGLFLKFKE